LNDAIAAKAEDELLRRLKTGSPLRFDRFMFLVLYSDPWGFYRRHTPGEDGTYRTSPTLSPWFAKLVCKDFVAMRRNLGSPRGFTIVEVGGGNGAFAREAIRSLPDEMLDGLRWVFVEPFDQIASRQKDAVSDLPGSFSWVTKLGEIEPVVGCVFANEVIDNFPARLFEVGDEELLEVYVSSDETGPLEVLLPVEGDSWAQSESKGPLEHLSPGDRFELKPMLSSWAEDASRALKSGYLLVIDYGDIQPSIWTRRPFGSLVTYRGESMGTDPLEALGSTDITSHVDFTSLAHAAHEAGFEAHHLSSQRDFLKRLGLDDVLADLRSAEREASTAGDFASYLATMAERSRVHALGTPGGLGDLRVLLATKDAPPLADIH